MATNALKKITTAAKSMRRKHPSMTWKAAIKKAGAAYRAKPVKRKTAAKKRVVRKSAAPKKRAVRKVVRKSTTTVSRSVGKLSAATHMSALKSMLLEELGRLEVRKFTARLKRDKTKIQKLITAKKTQLRRLAK